MKDIVPHPFDSAHVLAEIKKNRHVIDNCPAHSFIVDNFNLHFGKKFECRNCGGYMDAVQAFRYAQGFAAAGGDPNAVIQGFAPTEAEHRRKDDAPALPAATFEEAWSKFEAAGYKYGADALERVKFGWRIAKGERPIT